jgi:type II secretory pathway pseudopilin PulG
MPRRIEVPRRPPGGWILLEVLAALAVLSLSLAGLFQAFSSAATAARIAEQRLQEVLAAQSALEQSAQWTLVSPGVPPLYEVRATVGVVTLTTWRLGEGDAR